MWDFGAFKMLFFPFSRNFFRFYWSSPHPEKPRTFCPSTPGKISKEAHVHNEPDQKYLPSFAQQLCPEEIAKGWVSGQTEMTDLKVMFFEF